ncbi:MAG: malonyl-CoA decarboxylase [Proteobacteria bacterium]|nr:malonyl-CoA decarboxylase [Pseudomonadota bacterium]
MPHTLSQMIDTIAEWGRSYLDAPGRKHSLKSAKNLCRTLLVRRGEASGTALAKEIVTAFSDMSQERKIAFLEMLATDFAPDPNDILKAAADYIKNQDFRSLNDLGKVIESPNQDLLRMINIAPGGTAAIITMRKILLKELKSRPLLEAVEADMLHLLTAWFNRGFLQFRQIDWHTPAVVLEKLIAYEAVHEIKGWRDLRRRLAEDRSCFAFFHPALPHEPLIFVEVAFTKGIATKIQPLLNQKKPKSKAAVADTAIFYSISNCQEGLKGISFGNFLIKQVVDSISKELPNIKTFCTLSPIPGFRKWVEANYLNHESKILTEEETKLLAKSNWHHKKTTREKLKRKIVQLCAQYLTQEKRKNRPIDPVTRFHLGNGAEIENVNWGADVSERGLDQSLGLMANYRYNPTRIVSNHESYINEGKIVVSSKVKKLLDN